MKIFTRSAAVVILAGVASLGASTPLRAPENVSPAFEVHTTIVPSAIRGYPLTLRNPPTFNASILLARPGTKQAYGAIDNLEVAPGRTERTRRTFGQLQLEFEAGIDAQAEKAVTVSTVTRAGVVLSRQQSTIWLRQPNPEVVPVQ